MQNSLKSQNTGYIIEDSADQLIKKLEGQGKRIKILNDDDLDDEVEDDA
jgi:hypothetical protein